MNDRWYMLTVIGRDRAGIVAGITQALYEGGAELGEASMLRLGGNFTIMLMVRSGLDEDAIAELVAPVADAMQLRLHIDPIEGRLHDQEEADVMVSISHADQPGIVAGVTARLAAAGLNILNLESSVIGGRQAPVYMLHIEGRATSGIDGLQAVIDDLKADGFDAVLQRFETLIG